MCCTWHKSRRWEVRHPCFSVSSGLSWPIPALPLIRSDSSTLSCFNLEPALPAPQGQSQHAGDRDMHLQDPFSCKCCMGWKWWLCSSVKMFPLWEGWSCGSSACCFPCCFPHWAEHMGNLRINPCVKVCWFFPPILLKYYHLQEAIQVVVNIFFLMGTL